MTLGEAEGVEDGIAVSVASAVNMNASILNQPISAYGLGMAEEPHHRRQPRVKTAPSVTYLAYRKSRIRLIDRPSQFTRTQYATV